MSANYEPSGWDWWMSAQADRTKIGTDLPVHDAEPMTGFYRTKPKDGSKPVAFWYVDGALKCLFDGKDVKEDFARGQWTWVCRLPVSHEAYTQRVETGQWPDEVVVEINGERQSTKDKAPPKKDEPPAGVGLPGREKKAAAESKAKAPNTKADKASAPAADANPRATMGDNSKPAGEFDADLENLKEEYAEWVRKLDAELKNGEPDTADHEARVSGIGDKLANIASRAEAMHKLRKQPILDAGREIDGAWKPFIGDASDQKRRAKDACRAYRIKLDKERREKEAQEAERRAAEEQAKSAQGNLVDDSAEQQTSRRRPATSKPQATGLVRRKYAVIDDPVKAATFLLTGLSEPLPALMAEIKKASERIMKNGMEVPGARLEESQEAR